MISASLKNEIQSLDINDKLSLVEELWDAIAEEPNNITVTDTQRAELMRRYSEHLKDPGSGSSIDTGLTRIKNNRV